MSADDRTSIGNLVVELGYCTTCQVEKGLAAMNGELRLGEMLVEMGYLTKYQLDWSLVYQGMERKQTQPAQVHAFVQAQHHGLVDDLREIASDVRDLTTKINSKS